MLARVLMLTGVILALLPLVAVAHDNDGACICLRQLYWPTFFGTAYYKGKYFEDSDNCEPDQASEAIWYGPTPQSITDNCALSAGCQCEYLGYGGDCDDSKPPQLPKFSIEGAKKYLQQTRPPGVGNIGDPVAIFKLTHPIDQRTFFAAVFQWIGADYIGLEIREDNSGSAVEPDDYYQPMKGPLSHDVLKARIDYDGNEYNAFIFCSNLECYSEPEHAHEPTPAKEPTPAESDRAKSK